MRKKELVKEERRKRWAQIAIGLFIIVIMVLSIVQIADYQNAGGVEYNGYTFEQSPEGIAVKLEKKTITVQSFPLERNGSVFQLQNLYGGVIPITTVPGIAPLVQDADYVIVLFDPNTGAEQLQFLDYARFELSKELPNMVSAVTQNSTAYPALPVVACEQAGGGYVVVEMKLVNETNVTFTREGDCLTVTGDPYGLLAAKDYLLLSYYGVITDA